MRFKEDQRSSSSVEGHFYSLLLFFPKRIKDVVGDGSWWSQCSSAILADGFVFLYHPSTTIYPAKELLDNETVCKESVHSNAHI